MPEQQTSLRSLRITVALLKSPDTLEERFGMVKALSRRGLRDERRMVTGIPVGKLECLATGSLREWQALEQASSVLEGLRRTI